MQQSTLPEWIVNPNPSLYLSDNYVTVDFENTILDGGEDFISPVDPRTRLVSASWDYLGEMKFKMGDEYHQDELLADIAKADFIVAHGGKHELQWLHRCGVDLTKIIIYDTAIGEYVYYGNRRGDFDLDTVSRRYGGRGKNPTFARLMKLGICPSTWPEKWLRKYNDEDVVMTRGVFLKQRAKLSGLGLLPTMYTRCLVTPMLADIERYGMQLDKDRVQSIHRKLSAEYNQIMVEMNAMTGGINPNSPAQMSAYLYETLGFPMPKKKPKREKPKTAEQLARAAKRKPQPVLGPTGKEYILALKPTTDAQKRFIELKKKQTYLNAKLTKSFQKFVDCVEDPETKGILQFRFNQMVTQNHRLSSSGTKHKIQGQNLDREVKPVFKARFPGWKVAEWDYAGIEWRVAAFLSQDPAMIRAIVDKEDIHSETASIIFQKVLRELHGSMPDRPTIKKLYDSIRQEAKPETFKPAYGGEYGTKEQMAYYKAFTEKYHVLAAEQTRWCYQVVNTGQFVTRTGLIFYWPKTRMETSRDRDGLKKVKFVVPSNNPADPKPIDVKRMIYNYPISSLATADISQIGTVCMWHRMKSLKLESFLTNAVHDAAIAEAKPEEVEVLNQIAQQGLIEDMLVYLERCYGIEFDVPLEIEASISDFWKNSDKWSKQWLQ